MTSRRLHLRGRPNHPEDDPRPLKVMRARTLISSRTLARVISGPFDHLVGAQQERFRHREAQRFGRREIDHQLELDRSWA